MRFRFSGAPIVPTRKAISADDSHGCNGLGDAAESPTPSGLQKTKKWDLRRAVAPHRARCNRGVEHEQLTAGGGASDEAEQPMAGAGLEARREESSPYPRNDLLEMADLGATLAHVGTAVLPIRTDEAPDAPLSPAQSQTHEEARDSRPPPPDGDVTLNSAPPQRTHATMIESFDFD